MKKNNRIRWIIGGTVIVVTILAMSFLNLSKNLVYFYTVDEVAAKWSELKGQTIKVGAFVKPGSVVRGAADKMDIAFVITDLKGHDMNVRHHGIPPDMFKEGQGVVVEGKLSDDGKVIHSHLLMVKHSEEYRKPDSHANADKASLEKSLVKEEQDK